ncbi:MAG: hypothetical protein AMS25_12835 [Gemmatimonas sp. SM23_52]|nr:MAG: hypothetical protein AMS25_12835 [Gemmatimonas sp. SM23_52]
MSSFLFALFLLSVGLVLYTYVGYPLVLATIATLRPRQDSAGPPSKWPFVSISLPAYNEEGTIGEALERLLALDYPADRRQILVVSDASTDRTDEVVARYVDRGVELLRMPKRVGKTGAENAAAGHLVGDIVVNTDASVRIDTQAIKSLVARFEDPSVGLASGHLVSIDGAAVGSNAGDKGYYGYEMWVRGLESRVCSVVQASGALYAIRLGIHRTPCPAELTRDTASLVTAWEQGYRTVSVEDAVCHVPRARSLRQEYRRKARTFTRGLGTLFYKRHILNPFRHGLFAWMVFSHKLCRWLVPWGMIAGLLAIAGLSATEAWARWTIGVASLLSVLALAGWLWPDNRRAPSKPLSVMAYLAATNVAVLHAWLNVLRGNTKGIWEPTRRKIEVMHGQSPAHESPPR